MATAGMTKSALKLSAIDHVVVHVRDLARSKAFYIDVLGMTVRSAGDGYAFLWCGESGQQIGLFEAGHGKAPNGADLNHLAFAVPCGTRAEIVEALAAHGVSARGRDGDPDCIYFDDPDGHCLQLVVPVRARRR
jgi:catechol 2,3-dioxygenase-like lactoylglutathione lyase family enzyme